MADLFEIPELLYLICKQMRKSDLARLLPTSRCLFECAMPLVWRSLPDSAPMILLRLLPNPDRYLSSNLGASFVEAILENLQPLDSQSLTRFNLYAPHVKGIVRHERNKQSNIAWGRLLILVEARPILPNLEIFKLSIKACGRLAKMFRYGEFVSYDYLFPYLCSTLVEIESVRDIDMHSRIEPWVLTRLISRIADKCPRLKSLKLKSSTGPRSMEEPEYDSSELASSLGQLHNLRAVRLGFAVLVPNVLISLGTLPNLQSLTLNEASTSAPFSGFDDTLKIPNDFLPEDSFPALRHLGIYLHFGFESACQIWNLTTLVCRPTSISVHICGKATRADVNFFMRLVRQSSPHVNSLCLESTRTKLPLLSPKILDCLAPLPLRRLQLSAMRGTGSEKFASEQFALAFPSMESLRVHGHTFSFKDLVFMARHMPRLRHLSISTKILANWPAKDELPALELTPSPSPIKFNFLSLNSSVATYFPTAAGREMANEEVEVIAAGLHALWPNGVTCATFSKVNWTDRVNAELERLRRAGGSQDLRQDTVPQRPLSKRVPPWLERV